MILIRKIPENQEDAGVVAKFVLVTTNERLSFWKAFFYDGIRLTELKLAGDANIQLMIAAYACIPEPLPFSHPYKPKFIGLHFTMPPIYRNLEQESKANF